MKLPTISKRSIARQIWPGLSPEAGVNRLIRWENGKYTLSREALHTLGWVLEGHIQAMKTYKESL